MKIAGNIAHGDDKIALGRDEKLLTPIIAPEDGWIVKLTAWLDGLGNPLGNQLMKGVIYQQTGELVAVGDPFLVDAGRVPFWGDFTFEEAGPVPIVGGSSYRVGALGAAVDGLTRIYGSPLAGGAEQGSDSYTDGPSDPVGPTTPIDFALSVYLTYITEIKLPVHDEIGYARLPFGTVQEVIGEAGSIAQSGRFATCGWHGTSFDPERGAFAVVRTGGPCGDLVGQRLRITRREGGLRRRVHVYCHTEAAFDAAPTEDISITRRAFMELGFLAEGTVPATVEII